MAAQTVDPRWLPKRVLVTRFSALGDVAMTIPVVYSVARANPDTQFIMATRASMAPMYINPPANLTVETVDLKTGPFSGPLGWWRLYRHLRAKYRFDAIADLHNVVRTRLLSLPAWVRRIPSAHLCKQRTERRALTRRAAKVMLPLTSQRARFRQVFHSLGLVVDQSFTSLFPREGAPAATFAHVTPPKAAGQIWIGIAPFAAHKGKVYPPALTEQVVAALSRERRVSLFLFGAGQQEASLLAGWAAKYPRTISLASQRLGFAVELALMSHLDAMLAMDSANMHLASLTATPVVTVWGATHPYCGFRPFRQDPANSIGLSMACRPCSIFGDRPCYRGDYHCLTGISPATVADKLLTTAACSR